MGIADQRTFRLLAQGAMRLRSVGRVAVSAVGRKVGMEGPDAPGRRSAPLRWLRLAADAGYHGRQGRWRRQEHLHERVGAGGAEVRARRSNRELEVSNFQTGCQTPAGRSGTKPLIFAWQGQKDLNPRPSVLEKSAFPARTNAWQNPSVKLRTRNQGLRGAMSNFHATDRHHIAPRLTVFLSDHHRHFLDDFSPAS